MDLLTRMDLALVYVEDNLTGEIDQEVLARIACCSAYNFYRMFSFITDISLTEYIRRRRLTMAAIELQSGNIKVIDLALKYGYDSPVSFSRAFQMLHGVTPTEARAGGVTLKAYPRISFQISIKGEKKMDYRIENKEAFQVFGYEGIFSTDGSGLNADILHDNAVHQNNPHELWNQNHANGAYEKLAADAGELPPFVSPDLCKVHGVCDYKQTEPVHSRTCSVHSKVKTARLTDTRSQISQQVHGLYSRLKSSNGIVLSKWSIACTSVFILNGCLPLNMSKPTV